MTRIVRYEWNGSEGVGLAEQDSVALLGPGFVGVADVLARLPDARAAAAGAERAPLDELPLLAPIDPGARIFAVAQNYAKHAEEISGTGAPPKPVMFMKPATSLVGPGDAIEIPPVTSFLDYEAELAVVVGRPGARLEPHEAAQLALAATCFNDGSARDLQPAELGGKPLIDWFSGKSVDRSGAIGPWLTICDGAGALDDLAIRCELNGEVVQDDRTSSMSASSAELIAFVSHRVALRPGDVVATGTPGGVGAARDRPLRDGDTVTVEVESVGRLTNPVVDVRA